MSDKPNQSSTFDYPAQMENILEASRVTGLVSHEEPEVHTDKTRVKLVGCRQCQRPMVVNSFYAPAKAICRVCQPPTEPKGTASNAVPVAGATDPAKAVNLADCLVNKAFARALCPVHPDDPEHEMELKSVSHAPSLGREGVPGETVMHQCNRCLAAVTYTTNYRSNFKRQNEARVKEPVGNPDAHMALLNGVRS